MKWGLGASGGEDLHYQQYHHCDDERDDRLLHVASEEVTSVFPLYTQRMACQSVPCCGDGSPQKGWVEERRDVWIGPGGKDYHVKACIAKKRAGCATSGRTRAAISSVI